MASITSSTASTTIQGLRQQIFANSAALFPQVAIQGRSFCDTGLVQPGDTFEVITIGDGGSGSGQVRALLLTGNPLAREIMVRGPAVQGFEAALRGLLDVITEALGWYTDTLLGEFENAEDCGEGQIDVIAVETGFDFAARLRLAGGS